MQELVNLACEIEGHPDNIAPAFFRGAGNLCNGGGRVHSISVPVSPKIHFAALIPPFELKTEVARGALPEEYSRRMRCII